MQSSISLANNPVVISLCYDKYYDLRQLKGGRVSGGCAFLPDPTLKNILNSLLIKMCQLKYMLSFLRSKSKLPITGPAFFHWHHISEVIYFQLVLLKPWKRPQFKKSWCHTILCTLYDAVASWCLSLKLAQGKRKGTKKGVVARAVILNHRGHIWNRKEMGMGDGSQSEKLFQSKWPWMTFRNNRDST